MVRKLKRKININQDQRLDDIKAIKNKKAQLMKDYEDIIFYEKRARENFTKRNYKKAIKDYDKAIGIFEKRGYKEAYCKAIEIFEEKGYEEILKNYNNTTEILKKNEIFKKQCDNLVFILYIGRGKVNLYLKKYKESLEDSKKISEKIMEKFGKKVIVYMNKIDAYIGLKQYEKVLECYNKAIKLAEGNEKILLYLSMGNLELELKNYKDALNYYNKIIARDKYNILSYSGRGYAYIGVKEYGKALNEFNEVLEILEKNKIAKDKQEDILLSIYIGKGKINLESKNYEEALKDYDKVLDIDNNHIGTYMCRSEANYELKNYEEALKDYDKVLEIIEKDKTDKDKQKDILLSIYIGKGKINLELKNYEEAAKNCDKAIIIDDKNVSILMIKSGIFLGKKKYKDALSICNEALKIDKERDNSKNFKIIYNQKGIIFSNIEEYEKALEEFNKAIKLDETFAAPYLNKANVKAKLKNYEEALKNYEKALNYDDKLEGAYIGKGIVYTEQQKKDIALENYEKAISLNKNCAPAYSGISILNYEKDILNKNDKNLLKPIKIDPKESVYKFNLSYFYKETCQISKGIEILDSYTQSDKNSKKYLFLLGQLLIDYFKQENLELKKNDKIERFVNEGCYIIVDNLKRIDELNFDIQEKLVDKIKPNLRKKFENKIKYLKEEKNECNKKYYMYKTIDKRLISDLNEKRMWKGKPEYFNDPFDPYYKKFSTILKEELERVRISCFTENNDNLLMWAHYGNNHKGVCFGYKFTDISMDDLTFFEKVIYKGLDTKIEIDGTAKLSVDINKELLTISEIYLRKHKDWEYEKEWRLINLDYKEDYYYNMKISEVYFGIDCSKEDKNLIKSIIKNNNKYKDDKVEFYEMIQGENLSVKVEDK